MNPKYRKAAVASTVLSAILVLASAPLVQAEDRSKCQHNIEKAEAKLSHAVSRHGERSSQARSAREHLSAERQSCWSHYHAWYNGQEGRWHNEQDWDHDDHR